MNRRVKAFLIIIFNSGIVSGIIVIIFGMLIALGPQFLFKVCAHDADSFPRCHWSAQTEIGMGFLIAGLGLAILFFNDQKIRLGLIIGIFFSAVIVLCIPHALVGGCGMMSMACRRVAFPCITLVGAILLAYSAFNAMYIEWSKGASQ